jgi:DNA-binding XRE family transcriptional regulator
MAEDIKKEIQEENLVKKTCRELGITQKELAEIIGVSKTTIFRWISQGLDKPSKLILEGLLCKKKFIELEAIFPSQIKISF